MHEFRVQLPDKIYHELREEAARSGRSASALARQAVEDWLHHRRRVARHGAIASFAVANAGSKLDLDIDLEAASLEYFALRRAARRRP